MSMNWRGGMRLKPETAKEITDCEIPDGMRRRLWEYAHRGDEPMVKAVFYAAEIRGLSGEDKMTILAFEALKMLEHYKALLLDWSMKQPNPPAIFTPEIDNG